jgi:hypothetical protein
MPTPQDRENFSAALSSICEVLQEVWLKNEQIILDAINNRIQPADAVTASEEVALVSTKVTKGLIEKFDLNKDDEKESIDSIHDPLDKAEFAYMTYSKARALLELLAPEEWSKFGTNLLETSPVLSEKHLDSLTKIMAEKREDILTAHTAPLKNRNTFSFKVIAALILVIITITILFTFIL